MTSPSPTLPLSLSPPLHSAFVPRDVCYSAKVTTTVVTVTQQAPYYSQKRWYLGNNNGKDDNIDVTHNVPIIRLRYAQEMG